MIVTPDYFRAIGISLLLGRFPADADDQAHPAAVVNQTMARRFWPNDPDPIGRRIKFGTPDSPNPWMPIVGVVADIRHQDLGTAPRPEVYVSHAQEPSRSMTLLARTEVDPLSLAGTVRQVVWSVDADQPVYLVRSMRQVIEDRTAGPRAMTKVMGVFSIFALLLAAVGVYGVVGYSVSERTHEIGIRIALGAGRGRILRMVLHQGMVLVVIGVAAGLAGALPLMRVIASLLFGVAPGDPLTYGAISALLLTVALIAMYLPARRAMGVDPLVALRYE
jgi:putative ABC transport system permease protein